MRSSIVRSLRQSVYVATDRLESNSLDRHTDFANESSSPTRDSFPIIESVGAPVKPFARFARILQRSSRKLARSGRDQIPDPHTAALLSGRLWPFQSRHLKS